jgi:post-segregation antitoxin (ccd killing protein)
MMAMDTMVLVQVSIPKALVKRLKVAAVQRDTTMSAVVTEAVAKALKERK